MASQTWITCPDQLVYQRPYEDAWGTLHDPTTEWDELLKNYKPWVMLIQVGDGRYTPNGETSLNRRRPHDLQGAKTLCRGHKQNQCPRSERLGQNQPQKTLKTQAKEKVEEQRSHSCGGYNRRVSARAKHLSFAFQVLREWLSKGMSCAFCMMLNAEKPRPIQF